MQHILILGSEGFIGRHLVLYFLRKDIKVYGCDLFEAPSQPYKYFKVSRLSPEWEYILSSNNFHYCINAAGSGNVPYSMDHPLLDFETNTLDSMRILDGIRRNNPSCKYIHISSAAVYGDPQSLPIKEEAAKRPLSPYGWHKLMAEQICQEYFQIYGVYTAIIRPFSVYGIGLKKQLLWDICNKLKTTDSITLFGTGKESRDFIHINDLCRLIDCLMAKAEFQCDVYNAASGVETSIQEVADIFQRRHNGRKEIHFSGQSRAGDPVNWHADITKTKSTGFIPSISLQDGVQEYISWFESQNEQ